MAADQYIDEAYLAGELGLDVVTALKRISGIQLDQKIAAATAVVQAHMRNSGYSTPSIVDDVNVKQAVVWATWVSLSKIPEASIPLPTDYKEDSHYVAFAGIVSGDIPLTVSLSEIGAVGGMKFTDSSPNSSTGHPQRSSRGNLVGY